MTQKAPTSSERTSTDFLILPINGYAHESPALRAWAATQTDTIMSRWDACLGAIRTYANYEQPDSAWHASDGDIAKMAGDVVQLFGAATIPQAVGIAAYNGFIKPRPFRNKIFALSDTALHRLSSLLSGVPPPKNVAARGTSELRETFQTRSSSLVVSRAFGCGLLRQAVDVAWRQYGIQAYQAPAELMPEERRIDHRQAKQAMVAGATGKITVGTNYRPPYRTHGRAAAYVAQSGRGLDDRQIGELFGVTHGAVRTAIYSLAQRVHSPSGRDSLITELFRHSMLFPVLPMPTSARVITNRPR